MTASDVSQDVALPVYTPASVAQDYPERMSELKIADVRRLFPEYKSLFGHFAHCEKIINDAVNAGTLLTDKGPVKVAKDTTKDYWYERLAAGSYQFKNVGNARIVRAAALVIHDTVVGFDPDKERAPRNVATGTSSTLNTDDSTALDIENGKVVIVKNRVTITITDYSDAHTVEWTLRRGMVAANKAWSTHYEKWEGAKIRAAAQKEREDIAAKVNKMSDEERAALLELLTKSN